MGTTHRPLQLQLISIEFLCETAFYIRETKIFFSPSKVSQI